MITLLLPCPETQRLIRTGVRMPAVPKDDGADHALHCPACSSLHHWRVSETVLALAP